MDEPRVDAHDGAADRRADSVERIRLVHEAMANSKDVFKAMPAEELTDFTESLRRRSSHAPCG